MHAEVLTLRKEFMNLEWRGATHNRPFLASCECLRRRGGVVPFFRTAKPGSSLKPENGLTNPSEIVTPHIADQLAEYAASLRYDDLDSATTESVKVLLIDSIGCAIAAHGEPMMERCRALSAGIGGQSTVIGTSHRTTMDLAAFVNGGAIRYYDMNDAYSGPGDPGHPSGVISACLAAAESQRASGTELLASIALAFEVNCRILDGSQLIPNGWDNTLPSSPAAAVAAGKLLGLDQRELTHAINLALISHLPTFQTRVQTLSDWKGLADAQAARNGVFAAQLAQQGITGPAPIFEGTCGLFRQLGFQFDMAINDFGGRSGKFKVNETRIKPYAAEFFSLTAIKAAVELAPLIDDLDNIREIQVDTSALGYKYLAQEPEKWHPRTRDAADHSMPFIVARAIVDGTITPDSYAPAAIDDPRVRMLMPKVIVREDPQFSAMYPAKSPNRVIVRRADGSSIESQVDDFPAFPSRAELEQKFHSNVRRHWTDDQCSRALDGLWRLDQSEDISDVFSLLLVER